MLVYINDYVSEESGLLTRIQDHITRASRSLLIATRNMAVNIGGVQFGTVYIRVPENWNVISNQITWQQCNKADVFVTLPRENGYNDEPITKQSGQCGKPGSFIRISYTFFKAKTENEMVSAGRKIMNEFVKLRYGVYSEIPYQNMLVAFNGHEFINSTCGKNIKWEINKSPVECIYPNEDCTYKILANQNHDSSVMFDTESQQSELFCNEKSHNQFAKSLQNKKCDSQSITSIILKHSDFNTYRTTRPHENIKFVIVKGQVRKIALVLDTSGSMANIIENMKKAVSDFVTNIVENSSHVGLVNFDNFGFIKSALLPMNDVNNRKTLARLIDQLSSGGYTNIPDGLAKGIQILGSSISDDSAVFGSIFVLSDGENNQENPYRYDYAINQVIKKGILVNAISYGSNTDNKFNELARGTGGNYIKVDPNSVYLNLLKQFTVKENCDTSLDQEKTVIEGNVAIYINGKIIVGNLTYIDDYVGMNIRFTITMTINVANYTFQLIGPGQKSFPESDRVIQSAGTTVTFLIPGRAEKGYYKFQMTSTVNSRVKRSSTTVNIVYTVSGKPESNSTRIILPTGELSISQIEMLNDTTSVLVTIDMTTCGILPIEIVTVILTIDTPSQVRNQIEMKDDGLGDDAIAGDKIFSVALYPKNLKDVGFYNFFATIEILNNVTREIIKRTVTLTSLRILAKQTNTIVDKIPPAKVEIINLFVTDLAKKRLRVQIYATGDDGMTGNISQYEIMINSSTTNIINKTAYASPRDVINFDLDLVNLTMVDKFEISVRGIDDSGNIGEWSSAQPFNWNYTNIVSNMFSNSQTTDLRIDVGGNGSDKIKVSATFLILLFLFSFH